MSKIIIGVDPDASKHGTAVYRDGALSYLKSLELMDLIGLINANLMDFNFDDNSILEVHVENVAAMNAVFRQRQSKAGSKPVQMKMANSVGRCQQAQIEIERACKSLGVKVVKHKISKQWKSTKVGKPMFEKTTGWKGRSNEDTRSAAYFGWLGVTGK